MQLQLKVRLTESTQLNTNKHIKMSLSLRPVWKHYLNYRDS